MEETMMLYDNTEPTSTRYVGVAGAHGRYDLAITTTAQFYGKRLVCLIQSGKTAILGLDDASDSSYVAEAFGIKEEAQADELMNILLSNL